MKSAAAQRASNEPLSAEPLSAGEKPSLKSQPAFKRPGLENSAHDFLRSLSVEKRLSERTVAMYALALEELQHAVQPRSLENLQAADIRLGLVRLQKKQQAPRSIAIALAAWRGYYRWLTKQGKADANPAQGLRAPRQKRLLPKALSIDTAMQLMEFSGDDAPTQRDRAMLELLYSSGLRLAELVSLDAQPLPDSLGWLADDFREVTVTGKGKKRRVVPVGRQAAAALQAWLKVRVKMAKPGENALFVGARGERIAAGVVQTRLKQRGLQQNLSNNLYPHMLRHSFASHVLQSSSDLRAVQEMLGHTSITSTQVYTQLDFQHLAKTYDLTHPRAHKKSDAAELMSNSDNKIAKNQAEK